MLAREEDAKTQLVSREKEVENSWSRGKGVEQLPQEAVDQRERLIQDGGKEGRERERKETRAVQEEEAGRRGRSSA